MIHPQSIKRRILIADDDPVFLSLASACLSAAGHSVTDVCDGAEALEILRYDTFDLAIIDLDMPRVDGLRLIGLVRGMAIVHQPGILVISATQDSATYNEARNLGADAFLTKPVDWSVLPVTIGQIIDRRSTRGMTTSIAPRRTNSH